MTQARSWLETEALKKQLTDMMSATSEDRWCSGWEIGISEELWREGGLWHLMANEIGAWPVMCDNTDHGGSDRHEFDWIPLEDWIAAHPETRFAQRRPNSVELG